MYGKGLWENCEYQFPRISPYNGFCCILLCYRKLMEIPVYFPCDEVYHWWKSNGKKAPILRKSMSNNFSGFPLTMGFVTFSCAMGNWWGNLCIFHPMKYRTGWESYGKKHPYYGKKNVNQFLRFSPFDGFCYNFPCYRKLMRKFMHFPSDGAYQKMGI